MNRRAFIDHDAFVDLLQTMNRLDGETYQDLETVYGDMSRLVVGLLSRTDPKVLQEMYTAGSWQGSANVRAMHEAAKLWMQRHRPEAAERRP